jgi:hypothetical protein
LQAKLNTCQRKKQARKNNLQNNPGQTPGFFLYEKNNKTIKRITDNVARMGGVDYCQRDHITALGNSRFIRRGVSRSQTLRFKRNIVGNRNVATYPFMVI